MPQSLIQGVRVGGSALPDGVMMLTPLAAAIARESAGGGFTVVATTRAVPKFGRIWRFHGGEHQAIAAYEAGLDLTLENVTTRSLYHPRCGTNLAMLALLFMIPGMVVGSVISGFLGYLVTV